MFSFYKDPEIFQCYCAFRISLSLCVSLSLSLDVEIRDQCHSSIASPHFFETEFLSNPRTHLYGQMTGKPKGSSCFCLLSVRIKGVNTTD